MDGWPKAGDVARLLRRIPSSNGPFAKLEGFLLGTQGTGNLPGSRMARMVAQSQRLSQFRKVDQRAEKDHERPCRWRRKSGPLWRREVNQNQGCGLEFSTAGLLHSGTGFLPRLPLV